MLAFVLGFGMGFAICFGKLVRSRKWKIDGLKSYAIGYGLMEEDEILLAMPDTFGSWHHRDVMMMMITQRVRTPESPPKSPSSPPCVVGEGVAQ